MAAEESVSPSESRAEEWLGNWTPMTVDYGEYDPLRAGSIDGTDRVPHDRAIVRAMTANCKFTSPGAFLLHISRCFVLQISHQKT